MFTRSLLLLSLACVLLLTGCGPSAPVADFSVSNADCEPPCPVRFTNLSQGEDLYYIWNFGDGIIITNEASPEHTYARGGSYMVSLSATNSQGTNQSVKTVVVRHFPDSLRLIGVQVLALAACADTPDVRFVLEDFFGEPMARSGMLPNLSCAQLPTDIPPGVTFWLPTSNDVFFSLFNGADGGAVSTLYSERIFQNNIQWAVDMGGQAPLTGSLQLKSPTGTGATLTLKLTFWGKYA